MDRLSKEKRSQNMAKIKSSNTAPERKIRSILHNLGYRFRLHKNNLPGKPDITLSKHKTVIFVHGCFWHRHEGCRYTTTPATRKEFWMKKFTNNIQRDKTVSKELKELGWAVLVIWECELRDVESLKQRLTVALS